MTICPICEHKSESSQGISGKDAANYKCTTCGEFILTRQFQLGLPDLSNKDKAKISAFTKEREIHGMPIVTIVNERQGVESNDSIRVSLEDIKAAIPQSPSEKMDRALRNLHKKTEFLGEVIEVINKRDYSVFFAENDRECDFLKSALEDTGWIVRQEPLKGHSLLVSNVAVTVKGWNHIAELERQRGGRNSSQAFVAMWFDPGLVGAYEKGIRKAVEAAGYKAIRIDNKEHNDKVCDQILAELRKSKFLIADFTEYRSGVFFEAGFALGIGIPVIWTCRDNYSHKLSEHFDTRQYNHIIWKDEFDLFERLLTRIQATIL